MGRHHATEVAERVCSAVIRVGVSGDTIVFVGELILCCDAKETGRTAERISLWSSHWDAGRDITEEGRHERGEVWVFEECLVRGTYIGVLIGVVHWGVFDYRQEGGIELLKEVDDEVGITPAVDHTVSARHHHVEAGYVPSELAPSRRRGARRTCASFFNW